MRFKFLLAFCRTFPTKCSTGWCISLFFVSVGILGIGSQAEAQTLGEAPIGIKVGDIDGQILPPAPIGSITVAENVSMNYFLLKNHTEEYVIFRFRFFDENNIARTVDITVDAKSSYGISYFGLELGFNSQKAGKSIIVTALVGGSGREIFCGEVTAKADRQYVFFNGTTYSLVSISSLLEAELFQTIEANADDREYFGTLKHRDYFLWMDSRGFHEYIGTPDRFQDNRVAEILRGRAGSPTWSAVEAGFLNSFSLAIASNASNTAAVMGNASQFANKYSELVNARVAAGQGVTAATFWIPNPLWRFFGKDKDGNVDWEDERAKIYLLRPFAEIIGGVRVFLTGLVIWMMYYFAFKKYIFTAQA
jgi:hypothetical protein